MKSENVLEDKGTTGRMKMSLFDGYVMWTGPEAIGVVREDRTASGLHMGPLRPPRRLW